MSHRIMLDRVCCAVALCCTANLAPPCATWVNPKLLFLFRRKMIFHTNNTKYNIWHVLITSPLHEPAADCNALLRTQHKDGPKLRANAPTSHRCVRPCRAIVRARITSLFPLRTYALFNIWGLVCSFEPHFCNRLY